MSDFIKQGLLLHLPTEILCKIFGYLTFDNISKIRAVCQQFNSVASSCLNAGFISAQAELSTSLKQIKEELPRRESERRKHKLYPRHDALQGLDTRFSLLKMTYNKYILSGACCFIPGKVLDEMFSVLHTINSCSPLQSTSGLLQEVRDISSMAMEHFDDKIAPLFRGCLSPDFDINLTYSSLSDGSRIPLTAAEAWPSFSTSSTDEYSKNSFPNCCKLRIARIRRVQRSNRATTKLLIKQFAQQRKELRRTRLDVSKRNRLLSELKGKVASQARQLHEVHSQLLELATQVHTLQATLSSDASLSKLPAHPHSNDITRSLSKSTSQCEVAPLQALREHSASIDLQRRRGSNELKRKHDSESVAASCGEEPGESDPAFKIVRTER